VNVRDLGHFKPADHLMKLRHHKIACRILGALHEQRALIRNVHVFPVNFYDGITGDSNQRNTVLPPVKQLNVSDLLSTDLKYDFLTGIVNSTL
jgi:hypothetical protein